MNESVTQIKSVIEEFLDKRLQSKLDKLKEGEDEKRQKLLESHQPGVWIADAAHRVGQIQQITHALKYIHPDAKGTNLNSPGNSESGDVLVGTHTIAGRCFTDVVGNAAALDVYKFLRLEVGGKTLLSRAVENDPALRLAFSSDEAKATLWMAAFSKLTQSKGVPASHKMAKQIYWPIEYKRYHLLGPLFPTSLVHQVWSTIREARFSEEAKLAREARKQKKGHPRGYSEYPNLVIQQFGGTKPQNISQLNSERYGENYLLPSCPPSWRSDPVKPPLRVESVFDGWFSRRSRVKHLVATLRGYLHSLPADRTNIAMRSKRAELVGYIIDELLLFAAELRELDQAWSRDEACKLNEDESCWLNPARAEIDPEFSKVYTWGDWKESVCKRFANWLNAQLTRKRDPLPLDDASAKQFKVDLEKELRFLRQEVNSYE